MSPEVGTPSRGDEDRGSAMAVSVAKTAGEFGMAATAVDRLSAAHAFAMAPRVARLENQRDPIYLHPGHTVLILLRDAGVVHPVTLAAAALTESEDPDFRIADALIRREIGDDVADLVAAVPMPGSEALAEDLVTAPERVRLVALAERLDHLRHAHMCSAEQAWRRAVHEEAMRVYSPVAERTHAKLAARYRHWGKAFGRRLELGLDEGRGERP